MLSNIIIKILKIFFINILSFALLHKYLFGRMPHIDLNTKMRILFAAEKVFYATGFKGTRTTLIAKVAGKA